MQTSSWRWHRSLQRSRARCRSTRSTEENTPRGITLPTLSRSTPQLTWEVEALAEDVVVHPKNRGGLGTVVAKAVQLGFEHVRSGYSYTKACEKLYAFSIPNDPDKKAVIMEFNRTLESEQNLKHAVNPRLQTFGGNNRNVFLRCSRARMQCEPDRDLAPNGVLDPDMLMSGRKGLQTALTKGLKFTVYHHLIDEKWPRIAEIGQAALNSVMVNKVTEMEGIVTLHSKPLQRSFDEALEDVLHTRPEWYAWGHSVAAVAEKLSKEQSVELASLLKTVVPSYHGILGGAYLDKVAALKWPSLVQRPKLRLAAIIAALLAPLEKVIDGKCTLMKDSDLNSLTAVKNAALVKDGEDMLDTAMAFLIKQKVSDEVRFKTYGWLMARVIYFITKRGKASAEARDFPSLFACGQEFVENARQETGKKIKGSWGGAALELSAVAVAAKEAKDAATHKSSDDGAAAHESLAEIKDPVHQLSKLGFVVGANVKSKCKDDNVNDEDKIYKILSVDKSGCQLVAMYKDAAQTVALEDVPKKFIVHRAKLTEPVALEKVCPSVSALWAIDQVKAHITMCLKHLEERTCKHVLVLENPTAAKATHDFSIGKMMFPPTAPMSCIVVQDAAKPLGSNVVDFGVLISPPAAKTDIRFGVRRLHNTDPSKPGAWVAPFWAITLTDDEDEVNMHLCTEKVLLGTGANQSTDFNLSVAVPVYKNRVAIKKGDVLKALAPKKSTASEPVAKKQKM